MIRTALLIGLGLLSVAQAGPEEAESCVRTRVWDGYADGWGIRTMTSESLAAGKTKNYLVTLYRDNQYRIEACGDDAVKNLDVILYDTEGKVLARDETADATPHFEFQPTKTGSYYVVVYQREVEGTAAAGVAMAVVYR